MSRRNRSGKRLLRLAGGLALGVAAAGTTLTMLPDRGVPQAENLLNRISNQRLTAFEERLTKDLNGALSRYISKRQYVLAVKVIWNPDIIPLVENPGLAKEQQKLPGFPIFVRAPDSPAGEEGTPPFVRLEVKVLVDETLPEYYERFVRKIVPIVARLDFNRGDQVSVLKETFPVLPKEEEIPPTLPEKELMEQLGQAPLPGSQQPPARIGVAVIPQAGGFQGIPPAFAQQGATSLAEAVQVAYDEGRLQDALRMVQVGFQRATTSRERSFYLGMEGSIYYTMNNTEGAKASWRRAVTFNPANLEVHEALNYLENQPAGGSQ